MNQFKRAQVVMLPTNKIDLNTICLNKVTGLFLCTKQHLIQNVFNTLIEYKSAVPQHLYIMSDIKSDMYPNGIELLEGEYAYFTINQTIVKINEVASICKDYYKKIIATTDTSLSESHKQLVKVNITTTKVVDNLPQPSQQFIERYIESYNKGEVITDVLVEMEIDEEIAGYEHSYLKINPKDNTIRISRLKNTYTRDEMIKIANKSYEIGLHNGSSEEYFNIEPIDHDEWLKDQ